MDGRDGRHHHRQHATQESEIAHSHDSSGKVHHFTEPKGWGWCRREVRAR
jgi:hypothetical protein